MVGEVQLGTAPLQTEAPEVECAEGDASMASLGIMVVAQTAASTSTKEAVSAGGLPQEGLVLTGADAEPPRTLV